LTGSRCWLLLRRALRLGLSLSLLNPPLLTYAILGERIVGRNSAAYCAAV
jgi:hypothetical protein